MPGPTTLTLDIDGPNGDDQVTLPASFIERLAESEEPAATVAGDLALFGCAQRVHVTVHHSEGDVDEELEEAERTTMELFEERFGASYGDITGHRE
jgi:hypothetical protein